MNGQGASLRGSSFVGSGVTMACRNAAFLIAAGLVALRLIYLAGPNLFPEETYYWNYAKHLDIGYLDHPPLIAWLIGLGTAAFGDGEFGVRIFALLSSLVATIFTFRLTTLLYGRRAGARAVLLMQVLPFFFMAGWVMTPDAPLTACWAGTLYYLARVLFDRRTLAWFGVGVCLGLGLLSKYTIALLGPATVLFLALDPASRFWFRRGAPYGSALLVALIFSPVMWWNAGHHWASFAFQSAGRVKEPRRFSLHQLAGSILLLLTPLGAFLAVRALAGRVETSHSGVDLDRETRCGLFARVFTLVPLSVFVAFSCVHRIKLNWTGPLWLAVIPLIAAQLTTPATVPRPFLRHGWNLTVAIFSLAYVALLHHLAFGIPGLGYSPKMELLPVGWSQLGRELGRQKDELQRTSAARVLIVALDRNFIASEAAFYQPDQRQAIRETTGRHLFGGTSLMYEYWFPAKEQDGATLLLVSFNQNSLNKPQLDAHCRKMGEIRKNLLQRDGKTIRPYYTRIAYDYRSAGSP